MPGLQAGAVWGCSAPSPPPTGDEDDSVSVTSGDTAPPPRAFGGLEIVDSTPSSFDVAYACASPRDCLSVYGSPPTGNTGPGDLFSPDGRFSFPEALVVGTYEVGVYNSLTLECATAPALTIVADQTTIWVISEVTSCF